MLVDQKRCSLDLGLLLLNLQPAFVVCTHLLSQNHPKWSVPYNQLMEYENQDLS